MIFAMVSPERLAEISFFQEIPQAALARLSGAAEEKKLGPNEFVLRQHDEAKWIFFLLSGCVQFFMRFEGVDDLLVGRTSEREALIGWSAFRIPYRYTASVRCEEPCELIRLPRDLLETVIQEDPEFGLLFLRRVAGTLADRLEQTRALLMTSGLLGAQAVCDER